ncbi:MAG TPA: hypothetical protein VEQ59_15715 [Polyangiaceae bacterium]|nr:hypothetical protein [Polyangiaceae bacterium]
MSIATGFARIARLSLLLLSPSACAFTTGHVRLDPISTESAAAGGGGREVVVFPAVDERPDTKRCGVKRNSYGSETADVLCTPEPSEWLSELILRGLDRAKFKVVTTVSAQSPDPLRIHLRLEHLFVDQIPGMFTVTLNTDVHVIVAADTATGLAAERNFFVQAKTDVGGVLDSGLQASADRATQQLADHIVDAVIALSKRYPSRGVAAPVAATEGLGGPLAAREVRP